MSATPPGVEFAVTSGTPSRPVRLRGTSTGRGPAFVALHGFLGGRSSWRHVVPSLAQRATVFAYDARGHGESDRADEQDYTVAALVDDAINVITTQADGPVDLLGHSLGGVTAMGVAIERPDLVRSLMLLDTAPKPSGGRSLNRLVPLLGRGTPRRRSQVIGALARSAVRLQRPKLVMPGVPPAERLAVLQDDLRHLDSAAFRNFLRELAGYPDVTAQLASIAVPTTVIVGERDHGLRPAADTMAATITGAELAVIVGGSHTPHDDDAAAWLAVVNSHLDRVHGA